MNRVPVTTPRTVHLGYEVGSGRAIEIPLAHTFVSGQTQQSGKTTTLRALVDRSGARALAFITKRARMIAGAFWEKARTSAEVLGELQKSGISPSNIELGNELKSLTQLGFLSRENKWYSVVPDMKVNVVEID